jgi:hypothetical protein
MIILNKLYLPYAASLKRVSDELYSLQHEVKRKPIITLIEYERQAKSNVDIR